MGPLMLQCLGPAWDRGSPGSALRLAAGGAELATAVAARDTETLRGCAAALRGVSATGQQGVAKRAEEQFCGEMYGVLI